jgi:DNA-binding response OmpR family regulator
MAKPECKNTADDHGSVAKYGLSPVNIIAIEDNPGDVALLKCSLALEGVSLKVCTTFDAGMEAIKEAISRDGEGVDIIITDLGFPDANRWDVVAQIKDVVGDNVPVLVLTGHTDVDVVTHCVADGAEGVISKESWNGNLMASVQAARRRALSRKERDERFLDQIREIYAPILSH